jgi:hypothetical protein
VCPPCRALQRLVATTPCGDIGTLSRSWPARTKCPRRLLDRRSNPNHRWLRERAPRPQGRFSLSPVDGESAGALGQARIGVHPPPHPTPRRPRPLIRIRRGSRSRSLPGPPATARRQAGEASVAGGLKRHAPLVDRTVLLEPVHRPVQTGGVHAQLRGDLAHGDTGTLLDQTQDVLLSARGAARAGPPIACRALRRAPPSRLRRCDRRLGGASIGASVALRCG